MLIGKRLKASRIKEKISQQQLAQMIGVSKVSICGYETGNRVPSINVLSKLANALKVSPNYLLGYDIRVIADKNEEYSLTISKEELLFLKELRKNRNLCNKVLSDPIRTVKQMKLYQSD